METDMQAPCSLGLFVATTVGLLAVAGCSPSDFLIGGQSSTATAAQRTQIAADAQLVAQVQRDQADTDMLADSETGFYTLAQAVEEAQMADEEAKPASTVTKQPTGTIRKAVRKVEVTTIVRAAAAEVSAATKAQLQIRRGALQAKAAGRLKTAMAAFKNGIETVKTKNEFGGLTFSISFDYRLPDGSTRTGASERVFNGDRILISATQTQEWVAADGRKRTMDRTIELQKDGSYKVTGTGTDTHKGQTRTFTFDKTVSSAGAISGAGSLTRGEGTKSARTVKLTIGGTEDKETATVTDATTSLSATAETSVETGNGSTVSVTETGSTSTVKVEAEAAAETQWQAAQPA
jgi:hypothetical protein